MLHLIPEEIQWHIWKIYYSKYVLAELVEECKKKDASLIQQYVKNLINSIIDDVINDVVV